jgi:hypothetical protein
MAFLLHPWREALIETWNSTIVRLGGFVMRSTQISLPELALIAVTRAGLGAGLGLLLANRMTEDQRKAAGWALLIGGAAATLPLAIDVLNRSCSADHAKADHNATVACA